MIAALVLVLAQATAATPTPAPAKLSGGFGQKPAAQAKARVVVTDQTLAPTGKGRGSFSVAGAPTAALPMISLDVSAEAKAAQERMDRAVHRGSWVAANIVYNEQIRQGARSEWDAAEAHCRRTPGCVPDPIPAGVLPTGDETLRKLHGNRFKR